MSKDREAIKALAGVIKEAVDHYDDEFDEKIVDIVIEIYGLDPVDGESEAFMRAEDYVASLMPEAYRLAADRMEEEFKRNDLSSKPPEPNLRSV